jgi:nitrous oxide reductase accessory protein NosL
MWRYKLAKREYEGEYLYGVVEDLGDYGYTDSIIGWWDRPDDPREVLKMMLSDIANTEDFLEWKGD